MGENRPLPDDRQLQIIHLTQRCQNDTFKSGGLSVTSKRQREVVTENWLTVSPQIEDLLQHDYPKRPEETVADNCPNGFGFLVLECYTLRYYAAGSAIMSKPSELSP